MVGNTARAAKSCNVDLASSGVNDATILDRFLRSDLQWAECDVRSNHEHQQLLVREVSFVDLPVHDDEFMLKLADVIEEVREAGRSIKLDFKDDLAVDKTLAILKESGLEDSRIWFCGRVGDLKESFFRQLRQAHPHAVIQCPVCSLGPVLLEDDSHKAYRILSTLEPWGVDRFSVRWNTPNLSGVIEAIEDLGFPANLYNVPNARVFDEAISLSPKSVTAVFHDFAMDGSSPRAGAGV